MEKWHTLHVFGYGETQEISDDEEKRAPNDALKELQPYLDAIWAQRPKDFPEEGRDFHAVTAFRNDIYEWSAKNRKYFRVEWSQIDPIFVDKLAEEVSNYVPPIVE